MYEGFAVKAYKCPYCGKYYMRTSAFADYMYICDKNPENIMVCNDCMYFIPPEPGWEPTYGQCKITKQKMAKRKRLVKDIHKKVNISDIKQYPTICKNWRAKEYCNSYYLINIKSIYMHPSSHGLNVRSLKQQSDIANSMNDFNYTVVTLTDDCDMNITRMVAETVESKLLAAYITCNNVNTPHAKLFSRYICGGLEIGWTDRVNNSLDILNTILPDKPTVDDFFEMDFSGQLFVIDFDPEDPDGEFLSYVNAVKPNKIFCQTRGATTTVLESIVQKQSDSKITVKQCETDYKNGKVYAIVGK